MKYPEIKRRFRAIEYKMSVEEKYTYLGYQLCGHMQRDEDGNLLVLMGAKAIDQLYGYMKEMTDKYYKEFKIEKENAAIIAYKKTFKHGRK